MYWEPTWDSGFRLAAVCQSVQCSSVTIECTEWIGAQVALINTLSRWHSMGYHIAPCHLYSSQRFRCICVQGTLSSMATREMSLISVHKLAIVMDRNMSSKLAEQCCAASKSLTQSYNSHFLSSSKNRHTFLLQCSVCVNIDVQKEGLLAGCDGSPRWVILLALYISFSISDSLTVFSSMKA